MKRPSFTTSDDPWTEGGFHERRRTHSSRRHPLLKVVPSGVALVVVAAIATWAVSRPTAHTGGDPGGRILDALQPLASVLPAGATDITTTSHDSSHASKCPYQSHSKSGWSAVLIGSSFYTALPSAEVVADVGAKLTQLGWQRVKPVWEHSVDQYPPQAAWRGELFPGQMATASIYQLPPGSGSYTGSWHFSAVADPPGFALAGCP